MMDASDRCAQSRLFRYCGGLIEASWLAAVALAPIFFNLLSQKTFEPDKIALLRSLGLIILAAWVVRWVDQKRPAGAGGSQSLVSVLGMPLTLSLGGLALLYLAATFFSVNPYVSFWGSYDRRQGTYTFLSYLVVFAAVAALLRTREQIDRLVTVILVASLPVALYGIVQRAGWDPVLEDYIEGRVFSMAGNAVSFAAYLVMVLPLTFWRIVQEWGPMRQSRPVFRVLHARLVFLMLLGAIQIAAIVVSESRGPMVGLAVSLAVGLVVSVALRRRWRLLRVPLCFGVLALAFVVLLNIPKGPLERLRSLPVLERFANALSPQTGSSERAEFWQEAPKLMLSRRPLAYADGQIDRQGHLRALFGYGPETLDDAIAHQYSMPGGMALRLDRFHNLVWDLWASVGAVGATAFLSFFLLVWFHSYRRLGFLESYPRNQNERDWGPILFWIIPIASAVAWASVLSIWQGPGFVGLGLQLGLVVGLAAFLMVPRLWKKRTCKAPVPIDRYSSTLLIALLAALAGHMVETAFAFQVASTATLLWAYVGIMVALPRSNTQDPLECSDTSSYKAYQPALVAGFVSALLLVPLVFTCMQRYWPDRLSIGTALSMALSRLPGGRMGSLSLLGLLGLIWLVANLALARNGLESRKGNRWVGQFFLAATISGIMVAGYAFLKAQQIAAIGALPGASASGLDVLTKSAGYEAIYLTFLTVLLVILLLCGFALSLDRLRIETNPRDARATQEEGTTNGWGTKRGLLTALIALPGALVATYLFNVNPVCADISLRWAETLHAKNVRPGSLYVFERAVSLDPKTYHYRERLAAALRDHAESRADDNEFRELMERAEQVLLDAQKLSRLNRHFVPLGDLYLTWGMRDVDPERKADLARKAGRAFEQALAFEPGIEYAWEQSANVDRFLLNNEAEAARKEDKARAIMQNPGSFGNSYADLSRVTFNSDLKRHHAGRAIEYYDLALTNFYAKAAQGELEPKDSTFPFHMGKGSAYLASNDLDHALACYRDAAKIPNEKDIWKAEQLLARLYYEKTNQTAALTHGVLAYHKAPAKEKPRLLKFIERAQKLPTAATAPK